MRYLRNLLASSRRKIKEFATMTSASSDAGSHVQCTANVSRLEMVSPTTVVDLRQESPTVRGFTLKVRDPKMEFKAGQWVDTFVPGVNEVGGFSICSSPGRLQREGLIDLAVKNSPALPTSWLFNKCNVGNEIFMRVGGDVFFYPSPKTPALDVLLIAGGIGINPLLSILRHTAELKQAVAKQTVESTASEVYSPGRTLLLYSAITQDELTFKHVIDKLCLENEEIRAKYFVTKTPSAETKVSYGRIGYQEVCTALQSLSPDRSVIYICGPSSMIESMESYLQLLGVDRTRIFYEKWD